MHISEIGLNLLFCFAVSVESVGAQSPQAPARLLTPFDEAAVAWAKVPGTSVIEGKVQIKTADGELKYGADQTIVLVPVSAHTTEWFERHIVRGENVEIPNPRISPYDHFTKADFYGHFRFSGIAAGEYYIVGAVNWRAAGDPYGSAKGGDLAIRARAEPGRTLRVTLGFREEDHCQDFLGQTVVPLPFERAIKPFLSVAPKGEFESTAAYNARSAAALTPATRTLVIAKTPEDPKFIMYDADAQKLSIAAFAFSNQNFDAFSAFRSANLDAEIPAGSANVDAVISSRDTPVGTYSASNSFGAVFLVTKIQRLTDVIFERQYADIASGMALFPDIVDPPWSVVELPMSPTDAQVLKPTLRLAFVVAPKPPFLVRGKHKVGQTTLQDPREITEEFKVLTADIQCGLVLDSKNKVLAAYRTN